MVDIKILAKRPTYFLQRMINYQPLYKHYVLCSKLETLWMLLREG